MVGFIEVSETSGSKYGMGSGVPLADTRPVVSNLAVDTRARRFGVGTALMDACEDMVKTWSFDEIVLQVRVGIEAGRGVWGVSLCMGLCSRVCAREWARVRACAHGNFPFSLPRSRIVHL